MKRSVLVLALALQVLPAAAVAQGVTLRGAVVSAETGERLPYVLLVLDGRERRFASEQGDFLFTGLAEGRYRLVARLVGYRPFDSTFTVRGQMPPLQVALQRVAVALTAIQVSGSRNCTEPGAPDPEANVDLATVFEQLTLNAQRHALLSDHYPFRLTVERTLSNVSQNGRVRHVVDTIVVSSRRQPYRRGQVVIDDPARDGWYLVHIPVLADLADSSFHATHCFTLEGLDDLGESRLLRLDFRVVAGMRETDVNGSAYLDPQTFQVRRISFALTHPGRVASGVTEYYARTSFREERPNLLVVNEVRSTTVMQRQPGPNPVVEYREMQRLLGVSFLRPLPAAADSTPPR